MLTDEDRAKLQAFVNRSSPGTPYLKRAKIVLLAGAGATQETIAAEVQISITRVRQMLRAFNRQGMTLFPEAILSVATYAAHEPISAVARAIVAELVASLEQYEADLTRETRVVAVHETRKAIRTLRTGLRLFEPYFENGLLRTYRKRARKSMRRLSRSRDIAVLLLKLEQYVAESLSAGRITEEERLALESLARYWQQRQNMANDDVRRYLQTGKYQRLLSDLSAFSRGDVGETVPPFPQTPPRTRHIAPVMIYDKLEAVRAVGDNLHDLQPERLHILRIATKELRYTLEFFEPLLGASAGQCIAVVRQMLSHLGDVNDARVHLEMLDGLQEPELVEAIMLYREVVVDQLGRLREGFPAIWSEFDTQTWREQLAVAVAVL